jgi:autotransporter-associated beta strand protein
VNATAEWAGPVLLGANQARVGAQSQGHLIISGVIDDGAATYALRTSSDPNSRTRGVELRAQNTYGGSTDLTRGTLFLGVDDALPTGSVLDVHWAGSNNGEYAGLDMAGFDQTVSALRNSGISGNAAAITNSGLTLSTLTLNQTVDTVYAGTIGGAVSVVKAGGGRLTLAHPTHHTGATAIQDGTLELGANNVLSGQSAVVLSGGQLALGATTNTLRIIDGDGRQYAGFRRGADGFCGANAGAWEGTLTITPCSHRPACARSRC